jgi:hypothetical protein
VDLIYFRFSYMKQSFSIEQVLEVWAHLGKEDVLQLP